MEKQISFQGVSLNPYGDISPDGELSACVNLQSHGGALRPSELGGKEVKVNGEYLELRFIHATSDYKHYIFYDEHNFYRLLWYNEDDIQDGVIESPILIAEDVRYINSINAVGNTLVVATELSINYYLFKDGRYINLGNLPELNVSFGLKAEFRYSNSIIVNIADSELSTDNLFEKELSEENKNIIIQAIKPTLLEFIKQASDEGYFINPFFVRYGLRLYDGSIIRQSSPILMSPTDGESPIIFITGLTPGLGDGRIYIWFVVGAPFCKLDALVNTDNVDFSSWSDIISSCCIGISSPVSTVNTEFSDFKFSNDSDSIPSCLSCFANSPIVSERDNYKKYNFLYMLTSVDSSYDGGVFGSVKILPAKTKESIDNAIMSTSVFYVVNEIVNIGVNNTRKNVDISSGVLANLVFKEQFTDDYMSHDQLAAKQSLVYNRRLILSNVKRKIFTGLNTESLFPFFSGNINPICYVYIKENGLNLIVENACKINMSAAAATYFFFPNINAYKVIIDNGDINAYLEADLKPHPLLNGAYAYGFSYVIRATKPYPSAEYLRWVTKQNEIYVSEVDNPFVFPVQGVNTIGTGEIIGLSAITTALSQGQFGSFPLMAFCTDGNYALQVNSEGLFSAVTPMQRDVCTNHKSITQIDGAIVFVSSKGVMLANGSDIQCISAALDGVFDDLSFIDSSRVKLLDNIPPVDYFQNCMIAYDYSGKRLLFMKPSSSVQEYGWQYDIENTKWQQIDFAGAMQVINVYPYSYIQQSGNDGNVIKKLELPFDYSNTDDTVSGTLVTRPIKLDSLQLKSISQIRLEGNYSRLQRLYLYASNNLREWHLISATTKKRMLLRGRYFKFFRIVIDSELSSNENISGCRIIYALRPDYRMR